MISAIDLKPAVRTSMVVCCERGRPGHSIEEVLGMAVVWGSIVILTSQ
ncbi:MAG TPA: hypothetical protein VFW11_15520 [Cyclobacteriaceae bacterium]|nr:hypothetical protein [Cyclobacteriaceae bacterium]